MHFHHALFNCHDYEMNINTFKFYDGLSMYFIPVNEKSSQSGLLFIIVSLCVIYFYADDKLSLAHCGCNTIAPKRCQKQL